MRFRTELNLSFSDININHHNTCFLIGSCFTTHLGKKLALNKFNTLVNPYGILYHPEIIKNVLTMSANKSTPDERYITSLDRRFVHYKYHSDISAMSTTDLVHLVDDINRSVHDFVKDADFVFITLGTAFYYRHKTLNIKVANCHKQANNLFDRRLSSVTEIVKDVQDMVETIKRQNQHCKVIFTVSPVRHIRDGIVSNSRSKSHLISAVHHVVDKYPGTIYFPAYELLIDDLRDYRYYQKDLIHPNDLAVEYIWEKFSEKVFSLSTKAIIKKLSAIKTSLAHRPFDPGGDSYKQMLMDLKDNILRLRDDHSLDMDAELGMVDDRLSL